MHDDVHIVAGECTTTFDGTREREHRGDVITLVKPDNTVLVHDADGYQPVAWLTRADSVQFTGEVLDARDGDDHLRVTVHEEHGGGRYPVTDAGVHVGFCPDCGGALVLADGRVICLDCDVAYSVPRDAAIRDATCDDCDLPRMRVERGAAFDLCIDRACESLDERVRERFDREWDCPDADCDGDLRVLRRGGLIAGCEHYPDCDTGFSMPTGVVDGTCDCGLAVFDTPSGRRCLDATCERPASTDDDSREVADSSPESA